MLCCGTDFRYSETEAAAARPEAAARTTSDGPPTQSPAANTPGNAFEGRSEAKVPLSEKSRPSSPAIGPCSAPVNPMLMRTRSASISKSPPGRSENLNGLPSGENSQSASPALSDFTRPRAPPKDLATTPHMRVPPSRCELEVRFLYSHMGHGVDGCLPSGGSGIISICTTLFAPWRIAVPTQSLPVSPPPMTRTFFPFALTGTPSSSPEIARFCPARNSRAKNMPSRFLPGTARSRGTGQPVQRHTASNLRMRYAADTSLPTSTPYSNMTPSAQSRPILLSTTRFSSLKSGIP